MKRLRPVLRRRKRVSRLGRRPVRKRKFAGKAKPARFRRNATLRRGRKRHRKYSRKRLYPRTYNRAYNMAFNMKYEEGFQAGYAQGLQEPYQPPASSDQLSAAPNPAVVP
ncbi:hypothetical protein [Paenibacillus prosopidis]|uniref:Uncharacterized protein n=1 Tax=Paenibacillus prosopidis TaxID=630520 RepID=A0A368W764_9BACL|nr:hypothetical protein [Paenibacillus prosopidis]RCW50906.1 hypothetical protein DFP97_10298 [Paenibacillus prosopidis]